MSTPLHAPKSVSRFSRFFAAVVFTALAATGAFAAGNAAALDGEPYVKAWRQSGETAVAQLNRSGSIPAEQRDVLKKVLDDNQAQLDHVVQLSKDPQLPAFDKTPNYKMIRAAGSALAARGLLRAKEGNLDGALEDELAVMALGRAVAWGVGRKPVTLDATIGYNVESTAVKNLLKLGVTGKLTAKEAARVLGALSRREKDGMPRMPEILRTEGHLAVQSLQDGVAGQGGAAPEVAAKLNGLEAAMAKELAQHVGKRLEAEFERRARLLEAGQPWPPIPLLPREEELAKLPFEEAIYLELLNTSMPSADAAMKRMQELEVVVGRLRSLCEKLSKQ